MTPALVRGDMGSAMERGGDTDGFALGLWAAPSRKPPGGAVDRRALRGALGPERLKEPFLSDWAGGRGHDPAVCAQGQYIHLYNCLNSALVDGLP